jgi:hypothetical protein
LAFFCVLSIPASLNGLGREESYEKKVVDYNFGSLIRTDARGEYEENNTIFGMEVSFTFVLLDSFLPNAHTTSDTDTGESISSHTLCYWSY